ncbi:MAG: hypothetical protein AB9880_07615 [Christensenellales bacterium]
MAKPRSRPVPSWVRLDNAAKIYPATRSGDWMAVYRLSVTLDEDIRRPLLSQALQSTLKRIPLFSYRLKAGLFWYFMESQGAKQPQVQDDVANPCLPINLPRNDHFMFRIRVHGGRIALELFHAMADGTGAMTFLLTLCAEYLRLRYGKRILPAPYILDVRDQPQPGEWEDSFPKYARQAERSRKEESAYPLRGTPAEKGYLQVTTGTLQTAQLQQLARRYGCTINTLLAAILLRCLLHIARLDHSPRRARMPLKLSMPINLRRYYPSQTLRNFSSYINVPVYPQYGQYSLEDLIRLVTHYVGLETSEQMINARFSGNVHAEQIKLLRVAPLFVKSAALKLMYLLTGERYFTSVLSNLGLIQLPAEMAKHVSRLDFIIGGAKRNPVSCGCLSMAGKTWITFSRTIREPTLEQLFFTTLVEEGIHVTIESNRRMSP